MKLALITGATSGIGEELAHLLAKKGINLLITGRDEAKLHALAEELRSSVNVLAASFDLAKADDRGALLKWSLPLLPDLVINNAGFGFYGEATEIGCEKQLQMIDVNIKALVEISLSHAAKMKEEKKECVILNVSSVAAFAPFPYFATYAATKAFVNSFSMALDQEMQPYGIRILTSCPGQVWTNFAKRASSGRYEHPKGSNKMNVSVAAKEIYQQIQKRKRLRSFDFTYRIAAFFMRYLPYSMALPLLARVMQRRK